MGKLHNGTRALALLALAACGGDDGAVTVDAPIAVDAAVDAALDAPAQCTRSPCSILPQCGCEATPATPVCDLDLNDLATGATKCRADQFHGTENTACTRSSTCAAEHLCVGRCARYCDDDDDCAGPGGLCILPVLFNNTPIPGVKICTTDCNPMDAVSAACPTNWACHLFQEGDGLRRWLTNCEQLPATPGTVGAVCARAADCAGGLDCVNDGTGIGRRCRPQCLCPGGDCTAGTCPAGTGTCWNYAPSATVGAVTYGRCF